MTFNCIGLFCEDIREEVSGSHTIVGVMPDNISVSGPPRKEDGQAIIVPKLGVYLRVKLEVAHKPVGSITARLSFPGLPDFPLGEIGPETIAKAFEDTAAKNLPLVGMIFKAVISPLQLSKSGVASAFAKVEDREILAAILNIQIVT